MSGALISIDSISKTFKDSQRPALENISAELLPGRITGLVGPDGAGKTTLIRLMAGLLVPSSGKIDIAGLNPVQDAAKLREFVGYMPQKFGLYEDLTVLENLELHADLRNVIGAERTTTFQRLMAFTDLTQFSARMAGKLSGGMKQKLGLACALLGKPRLLLLDEPGVGVDPISRRELWKMVHELIAQSISVVWSTAYLDEAELCQDVLLMNEGKLIFNGNPAEMTSRIRERSIQIRCISGNRRQLLARALRRPEVMDGVIQGHNVRLVLRTNAAQPNLQELDAGKDAQLAAVTPRFEDAFIEALGGGPGGDSVLAQRMKPIPNDDKTVVEAVALTKMFGNFAATDHVTFAVKRGEIFGLLGPNGAGKSTTFRMMCGLIAPTSGTARVMGIDLKSAASLARQQLGYMAQKFSLYGGLSVQQNLTFFSGIYGLKGEQQQKAINGMIDIFKLHPYLKTAPDTLSLGFKQRLALACAVTARVSDGETLEMRDEMLSI